MTYKEKIVDTILGKGWSWFKQFMGLVAEDFPEVDRKTLAEFASLLRRFYMDSYKATRTAQTDH